MEDRLSEHFCYDCAFKHLSAARVLWNEVNTGYLNVDHISYIVGNMALAEVHIFEKHPEIAESIREGRKKFWDSIAAGDMERPDFEDCLGQLYKVATDWGLEDSVNLADLAPDPEEKVNLSDLKLDFEGTAADITKDKNRKVPKGSTDVVAPSKQAISEALQLDIDLSVAQKGGS